MRIHARSGIASRLFTTVLAAVLLCSFVPAVAGAETVDGLIAPYDTETSEWYVDPVGGSDSNAGTSWDAAFKTITTAVTAADGADIVHLGQGTFAEEFPLTVGLADNGILFEGAGAGKTILDGSGTDWMFEIVDGADVGFENMTFANGYNAYGLGGAIFAEWGLLGLVGCEFDSNFASEGGAVYATEAQVYVEDCDFHDNGHDPDLIAQPSALAEEPDVCMFGGAIALSGSEYSIYDSTFDSNHAVWGGAVSAELSTGDIDGCSFADNSSIGMFAMQGAVSLADVGALSPAPLFGGVVSGIGGDVAVSGSTFLGNFVLGGPISGYAIDMTATDCEFVDNEALVGSALVMGEGVFNTGSAEKMGISPQVELPTGSLTMERCVVTGNDGAAAGAAAIVADSYITNTLIADNDGLEAGIMTLSAQSAVINCTIAGNHAEMGVLNQSLLANAGLEPASPSGVVNSIIWEGAQYSVMGATVVASDLATGAAEFVVPFSASSALVPLGAPTMDYISEDPQFVSPAMGDYRLKAGSPCIDTGMDFELAPSDDLDGLSRPVDGDDDTVEEYDMGSYEFFGNTTGRVWGVNRYRTAIEISKDHFGVADTVVLATGRTFADGLAASGLAGVFRAPLLLTDTTELPYGVANEIERLGASRVIIVGGTSAIAAGIAADLGDMGLMVERIGGVNRYSTAAMIADRIVEEDPAAGDLVFLARGDLFADALTASPVAYTNHAPVLLVRPDEMPEATVDVISTLGASQAVIVGGTAAVSSGVEARASALVDSPTERISGANRYETSAKFSEWAVDNGLAAWNVMGVATGLDFPDALSGGAALGTQNGTLVLTPKDSVHPAIDKLLSAVGDEIVRLQLFGGVNAVDEATKTQLMGYLP